MLFRAWLIVWGIVVAVLPFAQAPTIRWHRGYGPSHAMRPWERLLMFIMGVGAICLGVFGSFNRN
jgi:hypothetical protein